MGVEYFGTCYEVLVSGNSGNSETKSPEFRAYFGA